MVAMGWPVKNLSFSFISTHDFHTIKDTTNQSMIKVERDTRSSRFSNRDQHNH